MRLLLLALAGWLAMPTGHAQGTSDKDLVPYARRSLHGYMVKAPDPVPGHPGLYRASFGCTLLPFPVVGHAQWDWGDCTGRAVETWLFARAMTGEATFGREIEDGQRATLLWLLSPDRGMPCVPERSDPAAGVYHYQMWDQGRTLRALVRWWLAEEDGPRKRDLAARIEKMIGGLREMATRGHDDQFGDWAAYPWDWAQGAQRGDDLFIMRGGQLLEPLALYWSASGSAPARQFAAEICAGVLSGHEADTYPAWARPIFAFSPDGSFGSHFHDHASIALGVARQGLALWQAGRRDQGLALLQWARRVYDWTLSPANVNAGSSWGWFPENVGTDNTQAREISEICCTADMIEFAAVLASAAPLDPSLQSNDALWDDVERWTWNTIVPTQFTVTPQYRAALSRALAGAATLANGYVQFALDPSGCYNHEACGYQTLRAGDGGHLSQMIYGVEYAGQRAWYAREASGLAAHGFVTEAPSAVVGDAIQGVVHTSDGALSITSRTTCGQGPYVVRRFVVRNTGTAPLPRVRFATCANLDFADWAENTGAVDAATGTLTVRSRMCPGVLALAGEPRPSFATTGDAGQLLASLGSFAWDAPALSCTGSPAGTLGWELGDLQPGEERLVTVTLAVVPDEKSLRRALRHEPFPPPAPGSMVDAGLIRTAERLDGSWVAVFTPNDLALRRADGTLDMNGMGCCHPAGVRGLWACWEAALADDGETLALRLPVSRAGAAVDRQVTEGPRMVEQRVQLRQARALRVRIPQWAGLAGVRVRDTRGSALPFSLAGRWLDLGRLPAGTRLTVTYPLRSRITRERVGGSGAGAGFCPAAEKRTFTAHWRGNTVVDLEPAGTLLPIFGPTAARLAP